MPDTASHTTPTDRAPDLQQAAQVAEQLRREIGKVIVGQQEVIEQLLICLFSRHHALLVGVPGLAKTRLISTLAQALGLDFRRIQFTPDLMPTDITGTEVIEENKATGERSLRFVPGPVFTHVLLADEINRTPPKTQAALLEAMQERHVTAGGSTMPLPDPFFVLATQNPIEQEGTYPLPEAQLDRFLCCIHVNYPDAQEELEIIRRTTGGHEVTAEQVVDADAIHAVQQLVRDVPVAEHVMAHALNLVRATRTPERGQADLRPDLLARCLDWGAGPRATQGLVLAAKARAVLAGRLTVTLEDVRAVALPVLRHRLLTSYAADSEGLETGDLVQHLLDKVQPVPENRQADRVLHGG